MLLVHRLQSVFLTVSNKSLEIFLVCGSIEYHTFNGDCALALKVPTFPIQYCVQK